MSSIPTSSSVTESAVIQAKFADVWHQIKLENFSNFWSNLKSSDFVKGASPDTDVVKWTFKDGTVLEVKQEAHSVSFCPFVAVPLFALTRTSKANIKFTSSRQSITTLPTRSLRLSHSLPTRLL